MMEKETYNTIKNQIGFALWNDGLDPKMLASGFRVLAPDGTEMNILVTEVK